MRQEIGMRAETLIDIRYAFGAELKALQERINHLMKYAL